MTLFIVDTSLRDLGDGLTENVLKKHVAHALRVGVDAIEAGEPTQGARATLRAQIIAYTVRGAWVMATAQATHRDIDLAWQAIQGAEQPMLLVAFSLSQPHLQVRSEKVAAHVDAIVQYARTLCPHVACLFDEVIQSDWDVLSRLCAIAQSSGAHLLTLADRPGYGLPHEFTAVLSWVQRQVHVKEHVLFGVQCGNRLGTATANTLAAITAGARCLSVSFLPPPHTSAALHDVMMALQLRADSFAGGHLTDHADSALISDRKDSMQQTSVRVIAICLVGIIISAPLTTLTGILPVIEQHLHLSAGALGWLSSSLFIGLVLACLPVGLLADRYGEDRLLLFSLLILAGGSCLLPLLPTFGWMVAMRLLIGIGTGGSFVCGSRLVASLGRASAVGQGLFGGSAVLGPVLAMILTPSWLQFVQWRGALFLWGLATMAGLLCWLWVTDFTPVKTTRERHQKRLHAGLRSRMIWALGLSNLGIFALGNISASWLALYFRTNFALSLSMSAVLASLGLCVGVLLRPLGGILLYRWPWHGVLFIRGGVGCSLGGMLLLSCAGVSLPLALLGIGLLSVGSTLPYAALYSLAAQTGEREQIGAGLAQGLLLVVIAPGLLLGAPALGWLLDHTGSFSLAFGCIGLLFGGIALAAASRLPQGPAAHHQASVHARRGQRHYARRVS